MAEPLIVITGATGQVGREVTPLLLEQRYRVRVIGRSAERLQPFVQRGAEAAVGTLEDPAFVTRALAGATAVFAVVPCAPRPNGYRTFPCWASESLAQAIVDNRVESAITLSCLGAHLSHGVGMVRGLYELEEQVNQAKANVLHLRAGCFMDNLLSALPDIAQKRCVWGALGSDVPVPMVACQDVARVAATALAARDFQGHNVLELLGPRDVTMNEVVEAFSRALNCRLRYVQLPYAEAQKAMEQSGLARGRAQALTEFFRGLNEGRIRPTHARAMKGAAPTSVDQFATRTLVPALAALLKGTGS